MGRASLLASRPVMAHQLSLSGTAVPEGGAMILHDAAA